jgi:hypothetical protein
MIVVEPPNIIPPVGLQASWFAIRSTLPCSLAPHFPIVLSRAPRALLTRLVQLRLQPLDLGLQHFAALMPSVVFGVLKLQFGPELVDL